MRMAWAEGPWQLFGVQEIYSASKTRKNQYYRREKRNKGETAAAVGSNIPLPSAVIARALCHRCLHLILISLRRCTAFRLNRRFFPLFSVRASLLFALESGKRKKNRMVSILNRQITSVTRRKLRAPHWNQQITTHSTRCYDNFTIFEIYVFNRLFKLLALVDEAIFDGIVT